MDKMQITKEISLELLSIKKQFHKDIPYLTADELDGLIFKICGKFEKNLKYEFRNYMKILGFIRHISVAKHDLCFAIELDQIKKYWEVKK